ncbi:MAG: 50S ribosomal protein L24 [Planctomycetota bacterium]
MLIKTGDTVQVLAGADRGTQSRVISIDRQAGKAIVEGVAKVYKHVRRSQRNPQGGRLSKEMPIQMSNLAYFCQSCDSASRLGARYLDDGSKERYCKKCNAGQGLIAPPKARYAKK